MSPVSTPPVTGTRTLVEAAHQTTVIPAITLRLRAVPTETRRIHWAEDVVDNEGLGRKQSKVCCIFHKTREIGESSDEDSDSDSSSDSDVGDDGASDGRARMTAKGKSKDRRHQHGDGKGDCGDCTGKDSKDRAKKKIRNAYEKVPKNGSTAEVKK